ncbi:MAG: NAD-dependent epimerase/dehydratase family protein [Bacteroidales bacterium]|nr:NAD-dependent epimerase/dehydratase family protein [Bacteroidales bacterium]
MEVLIVGGTGVLSSAVTAEALNRGVGVTMINRGRRRIPNGVELIKADKNDTQAIAKELGGRKFDAVIDFLCFTEEQTEASVRFYSQYTEQYFYISSCAVYDTASLDGQMADEDSKKVLPIWKYSVDKWASESKVRALLDGSDVNYTIIRPCVTYGDTRIPYGIMPPYGYHWTLCARILAGKPVIVWNGGRNRCNMTRVEDFAAGIVGLIGNPKAYNEAFNICGEETPSFSEVLDVLSRLLHKEIVRVDIPSDYYAKECPSKKGEILGGRSIDSINSNRKIKDAVSSFRQSVNLEEGIRRTLEAYQAQDFQKGIDWVFDADQDRIVAKWCRKNGISWNDYKLGFTDYLGTATSADRRLYWLVAHKDIFFVRILFIMRKALNKISGAAKK